MAITIKVSGDKKEKYVTRGFDVTNVIVKCVVVGETNPEKMFVEKSITLDGKFDGAEILTYLVIERNKKLDGLMPIEVKKTETTKEYYKISASMFRKFGEKISKEDAEKEEA